MANLFNEEELQIIKNEHFTTNVDSETMKNILQEIKYFKVRETDVIVVGYPRCGTTWTQEMVWLIANDLNFEKAKIFIDERFPNLEVIAFNMKQNPDITIPEYYSDSIKFIDRMTDPRFYKTHVKPSLLPDQILTGQVKPKMIYVHRDVKDACLSSYHYLKNVVKLYDGPLENYYKHYILKDDLLGNFWDSVLYFWKRRHEENVLFITYEEMKNDLLEVVRRVATFLDKKLTGKQEIELSKWLEFKNCQNNPALNHNDIYKQSGFIRLGKIGQYTKEMSPEIIEKLDSWSKQCVEGSDYDYLN